MSQFIKLMNKYILCSGRQYGAQGSIPTPSSSMLEDRLATCPYTNDTATGTTLCPSNTSGGPSSFSFYK